MSRFAGLHGENNLSLKGFGINVWIPIFHNQSLFILGVALQRSRPRAFVKISIVAFLMSGHLFRLFSLAGIFQCINRAAKWTGIPVFEARRRWAAPSFCFGCWPAPCVHQRRAPAPCTSVTVTVHELGAQRLQFLWVLAYKLRQLMFMFSTVFKVVHWSASFFFFFKYLLYDWADLNECQCSCMYEWMNGFASIFVMSWHCKQSS